MKKAAFVIFIVLLIDQVSKIWVKTQMYQGEEFAMFGDWFIIHFIENPGMAFGIELGGAAGKLALSLFRVIAIGAIAVFLFKTIKRGAPKGLIFFGSLILAGAIGNIIDSAVYGLIFTDSPLYHYDDPSNIISVYDPANGYAGFLYGNVVDMLNFPLFDFVWPDWVPYLGGTTFEFFKPVFNVADTAIATGIIAIMVFQKKYFPREVSEIPEAGEGQNVSHE